MKIEPLILEGGAIRLVPLEMTHVAELCTIGLEPGLWRGTTIQVKTPAEMEAYVRDALAAQRVGTALPFSIVERTTGRIVGTTRFHSIVVSDRRLELGFTWIALPWQRTAVNTEAKYLMLRQAFDAYGCLRVEFKTDVDNQQSRRALVRIGAKPEGVLRNYRVSVLRGVRDLAVYSIIASEWPEVRAALETRLKLTGVKG